LPPEFPWRELPRSETRGRRACQSPVRTITFDCCGGLAGRRRRCSQNLSETPRGTPANGNSGLRLTIINAAPYVGLMTKAANEGQRHACQGLHNGPVLAYVSSRTVRLTVASHARDRFFLRFAAPPGG
jgi:hypothetical protein